MRIYNEDSKANSLFAAIKRGKIQKIKVHPDPAVLT